MNNMKEVIKHLRAAQPHMKSMCDALSSHAMPDVQQMVNDAQRKARANGRLDDLVEVDAFISSASNLECKHIIHTLIDRIGALAGDVSYLEDAAYKLSTEIAAQRLADNPPICSACNGSGEGQSDDAICQACRGCGAELDAGIQP